MNYKTEAFKLRMRSITLPVLQILSAHLEVIELQLEALKTKTPNLFQGTPVIVDIELLEQNDSVYWEKLFGLLRHYGILPVGIQGIGSVAKEDFSRVGIAIFSPDKSNEKESKRSAALETKKTTISSSQKNLNAQAKIISKPIRSGQQVYAEGADLIVLASVSPGAELLADGNIHVYGTLRGRALAGIQGNRDARIFCQQLEADLIAIAGSYMTSDTIDRYRTNGAQQVVLEEGRLVISAL